MGIITATRQSFRRFDRYVERFTDLLRRRQVCSVSDLRRTLNDTAFRAQWNQVWHEIAMAEGGKLTLSTVLGIIGLILGGAGIAVGGGAIGLPLVLLLTPAGFLAGQELDEGGVTGKIVVTVHKWIGRFFGTKQEIPSTSEWYDSVQQAEFGDEPRAQILDEPIEESKSDSEVSTLLVQMNELSGRISALEQRLQASADTIADVQRTTGRNIQEIRDEVARCLTPLRSQLDRLEAATREQQERNSDVVSRISELESMSRKASRSIRLLIFSTCAVGVFALAELVWILGGR